MSDSSSGLGPSTSGRGGASSSSNSGGGAAGLFYSPHQPPSTTTLALTIAGAAVAGAVVWHFTRESYYAYVPPQASYMGVQSQGSRCRGIRAKGRVQPAAGRQAEGTPPAAAADNPAACLPSFHASCCCQQADGACSMTG